jgi:Mg2+ and Co2+ transporter CorA
MVIKTGEEENPEEAIPEEPEEVLPTMPTRRGRRKQIKLELEKDLEQELKKLDGSSLVKILNFLHKTYLSWITEAEAEKYYTVSTRAFDEALRRQEKTVTELAEQFGRTLSDKIAPVLETLDRRLEQLEKRIERVEAKAPSPIDERLIALGLVFIDALSDKFPTLKQYRPIIQSLIVSTAQKYLQSTQEKEETTEETTE